MTAQLEAMAIAGRLDLLAYFLGMAKSGKRNLCSHQRRRRSRARGREQPFEVAVGLPHGSNSFD